MIETVCVSKQRQALMGVATVLIVFFHYGAIYKYYEIQNSYVSVFLYSVLGAVGVDIFVFLSGIGINYSLSKNTIKRFYCNRLRRVLPPYIVVGGVFWFLIDLVILRNGMIRFLADYSTVSFWTSGENKLWFVPFILLMYLLSPMIFHSHEKVKKEYQIVLWIFLSIMITTIIYFTNEEVYWNLEIALKRIPIFLFGFLFGEWMKEKKEIPKTIIVLSSLLTVFVYLLVKKSNIPLADRYEYSFIAVMFCIVFSTIAERLGRVPGEKVLRYIGLRSFEVYLCHVSCIWICIVKQVMLPNIVIYCLVLMIALMMAIATFKMCSKLPNLMTKGAES